MTVLRTTPESEATGLTAKIYDDDVQSLGYVTTHTKTMAVNPEAYEAFEALLGTITAAMDLRRYELVTLAAAAAIGSTHCRLAHGRKALKAIPEAELLRIARDFRNAGLPPAEVAMMEYAEKLSSNAAEMTKADGLRLREHGFSDKEIMDITLAAAARNYLSRSVLALGVELDRPPTLSSELQDALLASMETHRA
ncbi:carboxymuconolactone decarboxylase family protein [Arthrobacter sp. ISL-65]|uniref:carboxymuconolactone decarboxylase family protein n=1 Tax=Arthrobacter sp. ISL-65 TaxID=2819112 RepID=UPI001BE5EEEA|nr:carboxymuconolactone decarboxylase family protein [Arthrobacter sp. ISL-65]MBT2547316.1 carboxymuconolactone decarboxylase family protein [Arthrobacter sp. ISL-65]